MISSLINNYILSKIYFFTKDKNFTKDELILIHRLLKKLNYKKHRILKIKKV